MIVNNNSKGGDDRDWRMGHRISRVLAAVSLLYSDSRLADRAFCFDSCRFSAFQFAARTVYVAVQSLDRQKSQQCFRP